MMWFGYVSLHSLVKYLKAYIMIVLIEKYYKYIVMISILFIIEWYAFYIGYIVNVIRNIH